MDFSFLQTFGFAADEITLSASLAERTWFKTGGVAECLLEPKKSIRLPELLAYCHDNEIPVFFLGDGSNLLVSDHGFPGLMISLKSLVPSSFCIDSRSYEHTLPAGMLVGDVVPLFCQRNQMGLQDFFGLPGTVGGAAFMNARCYDAEWSQIFLRASVILPNGERKIVEKDSSDWGYKRSPFQTPGLLIESVTVHLNEGPGASQLEEIAQARFHDREKKGHFKAPCAGSTFKNNREFGQPSGKIIDSLGLRGYRIGGAQVSPHHANILINAGNAQAQHIYDLAMHIQQKVKEAYGYYLEPEVVFLGKFAH